MMKLTGNERLFHAIGPALNCNSKPTNTSQAPTAKPSTNFHGRVHIMVYRFYLFMIVLLFTAKGKYKQRPAQAYMGINREQLKSESTAFV